MVLSSTGGPDHVGNVCSAPIMINGSSVITNPQFYYLYHFSHYFLPGSSVIQVNLGGGYPAGTFEAAACVNTDATNTIAVAVVNLATTAVPYKIVYGSLIVKYTANPNSISTITFPKAQ